MSAKRKLVDPVAPSVNTEQGQRPEGSNLGAPQSRAVVKRQRVSRACDQCRAAREKCDGIQPLCFPCVSQNRPCTYQANPKKRGVQTGYIRTLELALAWVFEKVPGSEHALSSLVGHEGGQGQRLLTGNDSSAANRLHRKWRRSRVHRDINRILSGGPSMSPPDDKSPSIDDATDTDGEVDRPSGRSCEPSQSTNTPPEQPTLTQSYQPSQSEGKRLDHAEQRSDKAATASLGPLSSATSVPPRGLKLPPNHWRLMDIYFSYTHCWLPILEKQEMFQTSYLYSPGQTLDLSSETSSSSAHAELWSALALASCQDAACTGATTSPQSAGSGTMTPSQIYHTARSLVPPDDGIFQIHHTRALILLSLVNLGRRNLASAWILIGKAVRTFLEISSRDRPALEKQRQRFRMVFIACFIMDTMVSQQSRKPPHLTVEDMTEAMNISENDLDEWQPWAACEGFGRGSDNTRNSRNPAYCLSTFNQVYDIFKVISRNMDRKKARTAYDRSSTVGLRQLQEAINTKAPFGTYILSSGVSSAPIPSPYLLKIFYLWATGLIETISSSAARLMTAVIEEYQVRFGACALPPFLAACLASWSSQTGFESLDPQDRARLSALENSHAEMWVTEPAISHPVYHNHGSSDISPAYQDMHKPAHRPTTTRLTAFSPVIPASSYADSDLLGAQSSQDPARHALPLSSPYTLSSYGNNPEGLFRPAAPVLNRDTARNAISDVEHAIATQAAATLPPPYHTATQSSTTSLSAAPNSTDYDTLLDDLASIDYADRVETDPQFMVNLGFAPGCDLNEFLSLDFARF
ncbi:hypothetical protein DL546_002363 [Coniochaeta pulveracea]|uniref:Zn(2)-C6 fungal-type domain-containing protein n=1 Tax=Coniochaeta pulveracea TaxID=177199 RepID=A0A420Y2E9_9PEZI|nr:hypothetical protein DL546_002363 [Coniochaeta pulveracea]